MNCRWENADEPDARGRRHVRCQRCGLYLKGLTPHAFDRIDSPCTAWPDWWEWGYWTAIMLAAIGVTTGRYDWLRKKLGLVPCKCPKRVVVLNTWGERALAWLVKRRAAK